MLKRHPIVPHKNICENASIPNAKTFLETRNNMKNKMAITKAIQIANRFFLMSRTIPKYPI
jgi:hypothetical protein